MTRFFVAANILFVTLSFLSNEAFCEPPDVGPRPATGVIDEAKILTDSQESALSTKLRGAFDSFGLEVYVAAYTFIRGESIMERSTRLRNSWARNPYAIAVVFDASSSQISFVRTHEFDQFLSKPEIEAVFSRAAARAVSRLKDLREKNLNLSKGELLTEAVDGLLRDPILTHNLKSKAEARFTPEMKGLLAGFIALGLLAAIAAFAFERRLRGNTESPTLKACYFPRTNRPIRLGAPNSGGFGATLEV